jgi:hypothetical protein
MKHLCHWRLNLQQMEHESVTIRKSDLLVIRGPNKCVALGSTETFGFRGTFRHAIF